MVVIVVLATAVLVVCPKCSLVLPHCSLVLPPCSLAKAASSLPLTKAEFADIKIGDLIYAGKLTPFLEASGMSVTEQAMMQAK